MIFIAAYLSGHFLLYALLLRHRRFFYGEKTIFLYHALSFLAVLGAGICLLALKQRDLCWFVAAVSLHGIYSLSFLEIWALSDGGYSLRILDRIDRTGLSADFASLETLGCSKKKYRLASLKRLGFIAPHPDGWALTARGRAAAAFLNFFVQISSQKGSG